MKSYNQITLIGGRGKEVKTGNTNSREWASFSVVTTESWKDKNGEWQEVKTWHNCLASANNVKLIKNSSPGDWVAVIGKYKKGKNDMFVSVDQLQVFGKPPKKEEAGPDGGGDDDLPF